MCIEERQEIEWNQTQAMMGEKIKDKVTKKDKAKAKIDSKTKSQIKETNSDSCQVMGLHMIQELNLMVTMDTDFMMKQYDMNSGQKLQTIILEKFQNESIEAVD